MIAVLESVFLPFEARQLSATFKAAPGSHCPPGIASLLVSRIQQGCWWKTMLSSLKDQLKVSLRETNWNSGKIKKDISNAKQHRTLCQLLCCC
jgi:hypothetical protein